MAELKQVAEEDSEMETVTDHSKQLLRRTSSAPSVSSEDADVKNPVFGDSEDCISPKPRRIGSVSEMISAEMMMVEERPAAAHPLRPRTYSAGSQVGSMTLNVDCGSTSPSPVSIGSPAPRVIQIRREESVDELTREFAKERDITSAFNLSRSWDETSWLGDKNYLTTNENRDTKRDSMDEAMFSSAISSPVRFIDKLHHNSRSLTPSPIGLPISPKQRTFRRSLSPSSLRPSLLSSKRKLDPDDHESYSCSPAKKYSLFNSPASTLSSLSSCSSPEHTSDTNSNRLSCDEDSGSENAFIPHSTLLNNINSPLTCDTRPLNSFAFVKPRYVAPQSPLAAGVTSVSIQNQQENHRKSSLSSVTNGPFASVNK